MYAELLKNTTKIEILMEGTPGKRKLNNKEPVPVKGMPGFRGTVQESPAGIRGYCAGNAAFLRAVRHFQPAPATKGVSIEFRIIIELVDRIKCGLAHAEHSNISQEDGSNNSQSACGDNTFIRKLNFNMFHGYLLLK